MPTQTLEALAIWRELQAATPPPMFLRVFVGGRARPQRKSRRKCKSEVVGYFKNRAAELGSYGLHPDPFIPSFPGSALAEGHGPLAGDRALKREKRLAPWGQMAASDTHYIGTWNSITSCPPWGTDLLPFSFGSSIPLSNILFGQTCHSSLEGN